MKNIFVTKKKKNYKKAFTLIELLIVIAIIGILFIVLVSKVDFATDKAKATGVQTTFRSYQMAFDQVARENSGFNAFGFDTGDKSIDLPSGYTYTNADKDRGDGVRNSYDEGDKNLNGKQDGTEVFTGRKFYTERWTGIWTLVKPGTTGYDAGALVELEGAINANLDPHLHITIATDGTITMANQARDPWKNEYHGVYISQAERDNGADRGAIIIYSNGANGKWGSAHDITNGVVTVTVPGNNVNGKDDYSLVSCYTFTNGYGEVQNMTTGFSNNKDFMAGNASFAPVVPGGNGGGAGNVGNGVVPEAPSPSEPEVVALAGLYETGTNYTKRLYTWDEMIELGWISRSRPIYINKPDMIVGDLVLPDNITGTLSTRFDECVNLTGIVIPEGVTDIGEWAFYECKSLVDIKLPSTLTSIGNYSFAECDALENVVLPSTVKSIGHGGFGWCDNLQHINLENVEYIANYGLYDTLIEEVTFSPNLYSIGENAFSYTPLQELDLRPLTKLTNIGLEAFYCCENLTFVALPEQLETIPWSCFARSPNLETVILPSNLKIIGNFAFEYCGLIRIDLPYGLEEIGTGAFSRNDNLSEISIPNSVHTMGSAIIRSTSVTELILPSSLITIPTNVDDEHVILTIHKGVQKIEASAVQAADRIIFLGTMQEWLDIEKDPKWLASSTLKNYGDITCLDGVLNPDGTIKT